MRLVRRIGAVGVAAALVVALVVGADTASAGRRGPGEITPSTLPVDAAPQVSWYDHDGDHLVRPGHQPVAVTTTGLLRNARGGWLASTGQGASFLGTDGHARRVGRPSAFEPVLVAGDGRTFVDRRLRVSASDSTKRATTVRVVRIRDGKVLRSRTFRQRVVDVQAAASSVVVLVVHRGARADTLVWNQRTGRTRVLRRHESGSAYGFPVPGASLSRHLVAVRHGARDVIRDSRTGRARWRTAPGEQTSRFSPDGTRVATFGDFEVVEDSLVPRVLRIRDARTGAVRATFHGVFRPEDDGSYLQDDGTIWESGSAVLFVAFEGIVSDDDGRSLSGPAWVRCATSGSCERVPIVVHTDYVTVPRSG